MPKIISFSWLLLAGTLAFQLRSAGQDVFSIWDGSTNLWNTPAHWQHSAPSVLGYPSNGVQTYSVEISSGEVSVQQPIMVDSLSLSGGRLLLDQPFIARTGVVWTSGNIEGASRLTVENRFQMTGTAPRLLPRETWMYGNSLIDGPTVIAPGEAWWNFGTLEWRGACLVSNLWAVFNNPGRLVKTGDGELVFDNSTHLDSFGEIDVQSGSIRLLGASGFGGRIKLQAGAALFVDDAWRSRSNAFVTGPGTIRVGGDASFGGGGGGVVVLSNMTVEVTDRARLSESSYFYPYTNGSGLVIGSDANVLLTSTNSGGSSDFPVGIGGLHMTNFGTVVMQVSGGAFAYFYNEGAVELRGGFSLSCVLNNRALIKKTGPGEIRGDSMSLLVNSGVIEVQEGSLHLGSRMTNNGTFLAHVGASNVVGESWSLNHSVLLDGTRFTGAGDHRMGSAMVLGAITNESHLYVQSVYPDSPGAIYNGPSATLRLGFAPCNVVNDGLTLSDPYGTTVSNLWNRGTLQLEGGDATGRIYNDGVLLKASNTVAVLSGLLLNSNLVQVQNGVLVVQSSFTNRARLNMESGGSFVIASNAVLSAGTELSGDGWLVVTNQGTLTIAHPLTNSVAMRLHLGNLSVQSNLTLSGSLVITNDAPYDYRGGVVTGPGDVTIASNATATLFGGDTYGPGVWHVLPGGSLELAPHHSSSPGVFKRSVVNEGTLRLGGYINGSGATLFNHGLTYASGQLGTTGTPVVVVNQGDWIVASNSDFNLGYSSVWFTNFGNLTVRGTFGPYLSEYEKADVVQRSGELVLEGGTLRGNYLIQGGTVRGSGTNLGELVSHGLLQPARTLAITSLVLGAGGRVRFDLGGTNIGIDFPRLACYFVRCSNDVTIDVRLTNGFVPQLGQQFEVVNCRYTLEMKGTSQFPVYPRFTGLKLPNGLRLAPILTYSNLTFVTMSSPPGGLANLRIQRAPFQLLILDFPPECAGFYLQQTTNLNAPWRTVSLLKFQPWFIGGSGPVNFYRLADSDFSE